MDSEHDPEYGLPIATQRTCETCGLQFAEVPVAAPSALHGTCPRCGAGTDDQDG